MDGCMNSTGAFRAWTLPARLWMPLAAILMSVSACATSTGADRALNPFCSIVGPPPAEMIPAEGEPFGWVDSYIATFDATCS